MRMKSFLSLTAIAVVLAACSIQEPDMTETYQAIGHKCVFTGSFEKETKTALLPNGKTTWWSRGDAISIYYGASEGSKFVATNDEDLFSKAIFQGSLPIFTGEIESGDVESFWAVYPFDAAVSCDGSSLVVSLPSQQTATAGSFANNTAVCIAQAPGLALSFYNVCSFFRFSVTKEGINRVEFRGNNDEYIAGSVREAFDTDGLPTTLEIIEGEKEIVLETQGNQSLVPGELYYIALLPSVLEEGFTMTLHTDSEAGSRRVEVTASFLRATYNNGYNFDASVEYEPTISVIKYTTSDDQPVALDPEAFDYDIDSHVYAEGEGGTITFTGFISEIGNGAFMGCSNLQTITIPGTVTTIGADAFRGTGLKGIEIPASVEEVGIGAFADCPELADITVSEANQGQCPARGMQKHNRS